MRKKRRRRNVTWQDAVRVCAWCGKAIPENTEHFALGAKARPGVNLEREGNVLELPLDATRKALAIIPAPDSQAKKEGWDLIFTLCSEECGRALRETVQRGIDIINSIARIA